MAGTNNTSKQALPRGEQRGKRLTLAILWYRAIFFAIVVAGAITGAVFLPVKDWLITGLEWTQSLGILGPVFVIAFYIAAAVLFLPGSILTLGAGFLFRVVVGTITVSIGSTLGACAAFLVGRTVGRNWIAGKVAKNQKFSAIDQAVAQQGFKIVLLTRLSPIFPFNLLNYVFGLTNISFWKYALGSWIGMIPGTVMYVYLGAGLRSLADVAAGDVEQGAARKVFFGFGLVVTIIVTVFVTRVARRALKQAAPDAVTDKTKTQAESS
jgi:uncharacterized membrane protein YdjX (TVP38/TMEM64 family)